MYPELKKVLQYIVDKITAHKLDTSYSLLSQAYQKIITASTPENDAEIQRLEKEIDTAQNDIEPVNFSNKELKIFFSYDTEQVLGARALVEQLRQLKDIRNNPHAVSEVYAQIGNEITVLHKRATQILGDLSDIWGEVNPQEDGRAQITLTFDREASIENLRSLQQQSADWVTIVAMSQRVLKKSTEDPVISTISKESPMDISMFGDPVLLTLIAYNFRMVMDIVKQILQIFQEVQRIEALAIDIESKKATLAILEESKQKALDAHINEVAEAVYQKLSKHLQESAEAKTAERFVVRNIYNFANNGGVVTINNPVTVNDTTGAAEQDVNTLQSVKQISDLRKQLNNPKLPKALIDPKAEQKIIKEPLKTEKQIAKPRRGRPPKVQPTQPATPVVIEKPTESTVETEKPKAK